MIGILKEKYRRFRQWQQQPLDYHDAHQHHVCCNCGAEADNHYCPRCGQKTSYGPISWGSVWQGLLDMWGMGSRSLPYTLWQLLWRPGYLIRDYISGKRNMSFPPVKMLVIISVVLFFVGYWIFPEFWWVFFDAETEVSTETGMLYYLETMGNWFSSHIEWAILAAFSLLIVPTWFVFRYAPDYPGHSLPQGFFIQVFMTVQFILWIFIGSLVIKLFQVNNVETIMMAVMFSTMFLVVLIDYHQLFGYSWWGTAWRLIAMVAMLFILFFLAILLQVPVYRVMNGVHVNWATIGAKIIGTSVLGFIFIIVVNDINRGVLKRGIRARKHIILLIAVLVGMMILLDASNHFRFFNSIKLMFKAFIGLFSGGY